MHEVAHGAVALSGVSVLVSLAFGSYLMWDIHSFSIDALKDLKEFQDLANLASTEMEANIRLPRSTMVQGGIYGRSAKSRIPRNYQSPQGAYAAPQRCACAAQANRCPSGPPGPPGSDGTPGYPGDPGQPGREGLSGMHQVMSSGAYGTPQSCIACPQGPPGFGGSDGEPGPPGTPGAPGLDGSMGRPGEPGAPGPSGDIGAPGAPGGSGPDGLPGEDGRRYTSEPGPPGPSGGMGPIGPPGPPGYAPAGTPGYPGPMGRPGSDGQPGGPGRPGSAGFPGSPGADAGYCPCPHRTSSYEQPRTSYYPAAATPAPTYTPDLHSRYTQQPSGYSSAGPYATAIRRSSAPRHSQSRAAAREQYGVPPMRSRKRMKHRQ